ncbi:unnamed protein product [Enterobius vermicularis]|uniref:Mediator complex subunit 4 n=1 Tax=Enterobius vermicularis TaxID=51028 RepID=A0A0N4VRM9_ENTVE|nr:unnamed protein product [Enterobius vermicularis]
MPDWATLPRSQQQETAAQLVIEVNEFEAQISNVLSQLIKANTNWQDITAGLSGAQKDEEQTIYHEMSQKPENLVDIVAAKAQLAVKEADERQPTPILRQFPHSSLQNPDLPPSKLPEFSSNLKE